MTAVAALHTLEPGTTFATRVVADGRDVVLVGGGNVGLAVAQALDAIARQPEAASTITRTLFVGLAMVESTAIYCLVVALVLLFANPLL